MVAMIVLQWKGKRRGIGSVMLLILFKAQEVVCQEK